MASGINKQQIKPGDIFFNAMIKSPISTWKLVIVKESIADKDGLTRVANIKTSQGRPTIP